MPPRNFPYCVQYCRSDEDYWEYCTRLMPGKTEWTYPTWREATNTFPSQRAYYGEDGYKYRVYNITTNEVVDYCPAEEYIEELKGTDKTHMVEVKFKKVSGKLFILINAKGLHEILDSIGVQSSGTPSKYLDRPYATDQVCNTGNYMLSTEVFLVKQYPLECDLTTVFGIPPTIDQLKKLAQSSFEQVRKILEHYQPIDIQVEIQKKVLKESA
jgi:hypothetical protein